MMIILNFYLFLQVHLPCFSIFDNFSFYTCHCYCHFLEFKNPKYNPNQIQDVNDNFHEVVIQINQFYQDHLRLQFQYIIYKGLVF